MWWLKRISSTSSSPSSSHVTLVTEIVEVEANDVWLETSVFMNLKRSHEWSVQSPQLGAGVKSWGNDVLDIWQGQRNKLKCAVAHFNTPLKIKQTGKVIKIDSKNALRRLKFDTEIAKTYYFCKPRPNRPLALVCGPGCVLCQKCGKRFWLILTRNLLMRRMHKLFHFFP